MIGDTSGTLRVRWGRGAVSVMANASDASAIKEED
jgi:hypothetical protein